MGNAAIAAGILCAVPNYYLLNDAPFHLERGPESPSYPRCAGEEGNDQQFLVRQTPGQGHGNRGRIYFFEIPKADNWNSAFRNAGAVLRGGLVWLRRRPRILTPTASSLAPTHQVSTTTGEPMATTRLTNAERSQRTRQALLDAGRTLFTTQGYAATAAEEIARQAGLTRGALYYHFHDKAALFEAVFDEVGQEYIASLRADILAGEEDGWQQLMTGVERFLNRMLDPSVRRILYIDGPVVLDWASSERRREPAFALLRDIFEPLMAAGHIKRLPLEALVRQLWALFFQAAVDIAGTEEGGLALHDRQVVLRHILYGLRPLDTPASLRDQVSKKASGEQRGSRRSV